jgi:hypothetical protein
LTALHGRSQTVLGSPPHAINLPGSPQSSCTVGVCLCAATLDRVHHPSVHLTLAGRPSTLLPSARLAVYGRPVPCVREQSMCRVEVNERALRQGRWGPPFFSPPICRFRITRAYSVSSSLSRPHCRCITRPFSPLALRRSVAGLPRRRHRRQHQPPRGRPRLGHTHQCSGTLPVCLTALCGPTASRTAAWKGSPQAYLPRA